ncbi:outer membrane beta-barrel protein [Halarcobacter bivalviorum]|uniref:OmpA domain-containing protein n=1 Tax=Halarcobacter bivalviorum TaxID=663364 RepID=A0AAX2A5M9_9BACT|nr:outer membrane beta-barrel protein [Halarcobacter bivalviorum]AXH11275.1 OmpA domain-containing protein [Halarcobacter bivalviorum]RXK05707.1 hypothetical protein CRU97_07280 [Halarcobacter bivalviorum]RXK09544.1 hypothetical protein CRV05_09570 [Halarcobacter bivalviorum]
MNKIKLGCALLLVVTLAQAENNNWYLGISAGQAKVDTGINTTSSTESLDEKDTGYKIFGGYQFNKYLATELYYSDLGTVTYKDSASSLNLEADIKSYGITGVVSYPIHKHIKPFLKAGLQHWKGKITGTNDINENSKIKGDGNKPIYGLGINFPITESISIRTEYEVIKLDESDSKFLSAGFVYRF